MADTTNVNADKLKQSGQKIGLYCRDISTAVTKINEALNNLAKGWKSDAATTFMQNWHTDQDALQEMIDQYGEIADMMIELATEFENSENETGSMVAKLNSR